MKAFNERLYCDCGGEMTYDPKDGAFLSNPPQYQHRCSDCNNVINIRGFTYPRIVYEEIDPPK